MSDDLRARYAEEIAAALKAWDGKPAVWGEDDCAMVIGNIDRAVTGNDSAAGFRGAYSSEQEAIALQGKAGLLGLVRRIAKKQGWRRFKRVEISSAQDGDRGIARVGPLQPVSVIRFSARWIARADRGNLMLFDRHIIAAWSIS